MKKSPKPVLAAVLLALSAVPASAHSGWTDRMIQGQVDGEALSCVVAAVQLVLTTVSVILARKWRPMRLLRLQFLRSHGKWWYPLLSVLPVALLSTFLLNILSVALWFFVFIPATVILVGYGVWAARLHWPPAYDRSWKRLFWLAVLSVQQLAGYAVYALTYKTHLVRKFFNYTDDEYQVTDYVVYPTLDTVGDDLKAAAAVAVILLAWHILFYAISLAQRWLRRRRARTSTRTDDQPE